MEIQDRILRIIPGVQHYDWGGNHFIPQLLRQSNHDQIPFAELWMGTHTSCPVMAVSSNHKTLLAEAIRQRKETFLGAAVAKKFGQLPYLLKVLDVRKMLSIQAHPSVQQAQAGFEAEEKAGIPLSHPARNYKDKNHKPEMMIALSDFWLLHGFKTEAELMETLQQHQSFHPLMAVLEQGGIGGLYKHIMQMPQPDVDTLLQPLMAAEKEKRNLGALQKTDPGFWTKNFEDGDSAGHFDRGIFSIYFLRLLNLEKGEAVFQPPGMPHAYLEGQNIEIMAASDNVLRGGLTNKHIDVAELLSTLTFSSQKPFYILPEFISEREAVFQPPVSDFGLSEIVLTENEQYAATTFSFEMFLVAAGSVKVESATFHSGEVFAVAANTRYSIRAESNTQIFKAFVPAV